MRYTLAPDCELEAEFELALPEVGVLSLLSLFVGDEMGQWLVGGGTAQLLFSTDPDEPGERLLDFAPSPDVQVRGRNAVYLAPVAPPPGDVSADPIYSAFGPPPDSCPPPRRDGVPLLGPVFFH